MNAPERYELFVLPDGVPKIKTVPDTKVLNAATFVVECEDHTLGNMLRMQLIDQKNVLFSGYRVPHPLKHNFELKVQTSRETSPKEALQQGIQNLIADLSFLEEKLRIELRKTADVNNGGDSHMRIW